MAEIRNENMSGAKAESLFFFEKAPDSMLLVDTTGRIIDFNEAAYRQLGYSREEFARFGHVRDVDPYSSDDRIQLRIGKLLKEGETEFVIRQRTKDGDLRDTHVKTRAISLSGQTVFYAICRDMTDYIMEALPGVVR